MARRNRRTIVSLVALLGVMLGGWMVLSASDAEPAAQPEAALSVNADGFFNEVKNGGGPPGGGCCDPALEPGGGIVPLCFEGHTCCANGSWQCNNPDGSPSCDPGTVCDAGCTSVGDPCGDDADCCSNRCKGGRCK